MCFASLEVGEGSSSVRIASALGFEMKTTKCPWVLCSRWGVQPRHSYFGDPSVVVTFPFPTCVRGPNTDCFCFPDWRRHPKSARPASPCSVV